MFGCARVHFLSFVVIFCSASIHGADCNGNGSEDVLDIDNAASADCNANGVPDECESAPLNFGLPPDTLELVGQVVDSVAVDLNGDGLLDVVVGGRESNFDSFFSVFLGRADGSFDPRLDFPAGARMAALVAGDFDDDGDVDLASTNSASLQVFLNDGNGNLAGSGEFDAPRSTNWITAVDVTGDGTLDLVTTSRFTHEVSVHVNKGAATFTEPDSYPVGRIPVTPVSADFNGDGIADLASASDRSGDISILFGEVGGGFAPAETVPGGARPRDLAAADLDGDGDADLVQALEGEIHVFLNPGGGTFASPQLNLPVDAGTVLLEDLTGDGRLDLVAGTNDRSRVHVWINLGGGNLAAAVTFIADQEKIIVGDFDMDSDLDLGLVTTDPPEVSFLINGLPGAAVVAFDTSMAAFGQEPHHAHIVDIDGDGDLDVLTGNGDNRSYTILSNDGTGRFDESLSTIVEEPVEFLRHDYIQTGDIDGDDDLDIVMADAWQDTVRVVPNQGDGTFVGHVDWEAGEQTRAVLLADVDSDGDLDIFSTGPGDSFVTQEGVDSDPQGTVTVLFNDGAGDFSQRVDFPAGDRPELAVQGDFDRDGDVDFAVANIVSSEVALFFNDGNGNFPPRVVYPVLGAPRTITTADFDGDDDLDLVTGNTESQDLAIFLNAGDGTFALDSTVKMRLVPYDLIPTDVNSDGVVDLAVANELNHTISIVLGNGDGTFQAAFQKDNAAGRGARFILSGDVDLDGDLDLIAANRQSRDLTIHRNTTGEDAPRDDFIESICTGRDFERWSLPERVGGMVERSMKYVAPARDEAGLLGTLFQNVQRFALHQEFLQNVFPDRFPSLTLDEYNRLTGIRESRDYYVGVISRLRTVDGPAYGFSVVYDTSDAEQVPAQEEVQQVFETLREVFTLEPLGYLPDTNAARDLAATWPDPEFPIFDESAPPDVIFEPYTRAVGYGRVRILDAEGFEEANESGQLSFQSILVLSEAPRDIEGVVGGVITAQRQGLLSHVAIRTARRNTPNAFVLDAAEEFAGFDGRLVRLEVKATTYTVADATLEEAEAFWAENRPQLSVLPTLDPDFTELPSLAEIAAMDVESRQENRFGGKATNLARLGGILEGSPFEHLREVGFAIPVHYYVEFMRANTIPSALDPQRVVTYEEHLAELFAATEFQSDSALRFELLDSFRDFARDNGVVNETLVERILERIPEVFPSTSTPLRFRSSSNVEDALEFNGAGLYESTGGCADDELDDDSDGPSRCDPTKENERDIRRALRKVWTSIYTFRAFEERAFYGIPEELVGMGILVSRSFPDELANGVAFTGNLANALDRRFVITAQVGEESVVSPDPGVFPEKDVLEIDNGEVVRIIRPTQGSSLVEPGVWVVSDEHLREMGRFMAFVDANFPIDLGTHRRDEVLLDLEFKIEPDNSLAFKQVRPFLLTDVPPPAPTFEVVVPDDTVVCGVFGLAGTGRGPRDEYELKSVVSLVGGTISLPTAQDTFSADLFDEVRFGQEQLLAEPQESGLFRVVSFAGPEETTVYRFTYEQPFVLPDGRLLVLSIRRPLIFTARDGEALDSPQVMDLEYFTAKPGEESIEASLDGDSRIRYGSCTNENLPVFEVVAELEDGTTIHLEERFLEQGSLFDTGPASLQSAEVSLRGVERTVTDYWSLVYSAARHNTRVRYWVVLDSPVSVDGIEGLVRGVELSMASPPDVPVPSAAYLGENFEVIATVAVREVTKNEPGAAGVSFLRGDVSADGNLNIVDALSLLDDLFVGGADRSCRKASDANDDGRVNIADAVEIASVLFRGKTGLPAPFGDCGEDPSTDSLTCAEFAGCP